MTREQAVAAIEVGIAKAEELHAQGYEMLATGEMESATLLPAVP